jgi:predicted lipid-binding transport protein (Tim44 family)
VSNYSPEIVKGIQAIKKHDSSFTVEGFISGAKTAFEWILRSYSTGDLETLKQLVNDEELEEFRKAIEAKEKKKQKEEIVIVSEPEVTIESIEVKRSKARIKTTIISEQIDFIQDKKGAVVEGDQSQVDQITDIWVFEKNLKSSDPNWILVETEIAN